MWLSVVIVSTKKRLCTSAIYTISMSKERNVEIDAVMTLDCCYTFTAIWKSNYFNYLLNVFVTCAPTTKSACCAGC